MPTSLSGNQADTTSSTVSRGFTSSWIVFDDAVCIRTGRLSTTPQPQPDSSVLTNQERIIQKIQDCASLTPNEKQSAINGVRREFARVGGHCGSTGIGSLMVWQCTPEGLDFWERINHAI
jgi:hypothetical protein